jgi:hypothetical protein
LLPLLLLAGGMLASATVMPPVRELLGTSTVGAATWLVVGAAGTAAYAVTRLLRARSL